MSSVSPPRLAARFERVVAVDGSASSRPVRGADSIWVGAVEGGVVQAPVNLSTRRELLAWLVDVGRLPGRTLIAVDWSLGYPSGAADAFGLVGSTPRLAMWEHLSRTIVDGTDNANNRFEVAGDLNAQSGLPGPFWGAPRSMVTASITSKKQRFDDLGEWRLAEAQVRASKRWVSSCWQLGGAGAVGGQSLVGIALLASLIDELVPRCVAVWPFDTGLSAPGDDVDVVIAEMWPSLFVTADELADAGVRDAVQVEVMARLLHAADVDGRLRRWWCPDVPPAEVGRVVGEEGWILGLP